MPRKMKKQFLLFNDNDREGYKIASVMYALDQFNKENGYPRTMAEHFREAIKATEVISTHPC